MKKKEIGCVKVRHLGDDGENPLLMLHGWGMNSDALRPLGELLGDYASIHLFDLPGFGDSPRPETTWGSEEYADRIIRYMDDNNIAAADLLGHSFGGRVALIMASRYPSRVRRVILIASAGIPSDRSAIQLLRFRALHALRAATRVVDAAIKTSLYRSWFVPHFASRDYTSAGDMRDILVKVVNEDLSTYASHIGAPTLILWGDRDSETPLSSGLRLSALIRNSSFVVLHGKSHILFDGVGAHLCAHHIIPFLKEGQR